MINTLVDNATIRLGYVSDNEATRIQFPIANTYSLFGSGGDWYLLNRRPEDENAYAVPPSQITTDDRFLYWTVAAYDVAQYGNGECQLQYRIGDVVKMMQKWRTAISASLVDGGVVPTPYQTWLDDLAEIEQNTIAASQHYPYIGENGDWYVWDVNTSAFVDTGVNAVGASFETIEERENAGQYTLTFTPKDVNFDGQYEGGEFLVGGYDGGIRFTDATVTAEYGVTAGGLNVSGETTLTGDATLNGAEIETKPVVLYIAYDEDDNEYRPADENGTFYTQAQMFELFNAGRSFVLCDNINYIGSYDGITFPLSIVEDVSGDQGEETYILATPFVTSSPYDETANAKFLQVWPISNSPSKATVLSDDLYIPDTNDKVSQQISSGNANYNVLFSWASGGASDVNFARKSTKLTFNPSNGYLNLTGRLIVNGNDVYTPNDGHLWTDNSGEDAEMLADNINISAADGMGITGKYIDMNSAGSYVGLSDDGFVTLRGSSQIDIDCENISVQGNPQQPYCSAGLSGYQWTAFAGTNGNDTVTFTMNGYVPSSRVGALVSCKAGYSWDFCGEITAVNNNEVTVKLVTAQWPTTGVDGVTNDWDPSSFIMSDSGYLWLPEVPTAGNYLIPGRRAAFGYKTAANEKGSFACGEETIADGRYSAAFGFNNKSGYAAFATGKGNIAAGDSSAALGQNNTIAAAWSTAVGSRHVLKRLYNFAAGYGNEVNTNFGMALGSNNKIGSDNTQDLANNSTAAGQHNTITNGVASFTSGDTNVVGSDDYASGQSIVVGQGNSVAQSATSHYAVVLGKENTADGEAVIAIGTKNEISAKGGVGIGGESVISGSTFVGNTVSGAGAVALGSGNTASNVGSVAVGLGNTAGGHATFVSGKQNTVSGAQALVGGYKNTVSASQSGAIGADNRVTGAHSIALGQGNMTATSEQVVVGKYNKADTNARFIVGCGTADNARANALSVRQNGDIIVNYNGTYYKLDLAALLAGGYLTAI